MTARVALRGELVGYALDAAYDRADVFVLASFLEGYGMAHAEALARGLPIVTTAAGAVTITVPSDAALLVPAGDRDALAGALARIVDDAALREGLKRGACRARERLPTWDDAGELFAQALERFA
jgi:glycosyltransferase involved in cell wall biosynthesis